MLVQVAVVIDALAAVPAVDPVVADQAVEAELLLGLHHQQRRRQAALVVGAAFAGAEQAKGDTPRFRLVEPVQVGDDEARLEAVGIDADFAGRIEHRVMHEDGIQELLRFVAAAGVLVEETEDVHLAEGHFQRFA